MKLEAFYKTIKDKNISDQLLIIKNPKSGNNFVAKQYINEIASQHNLVKEFIEDSSEVKTTSTFFDNYIEPTLQIYITDKFDVEDQSLVNRTNLIINCNSISKTATKLFNDYIIEIPELLDWQVADYIYSKLDGTDESVLSKLTKLCQLNIYRADIEIDRLKLFTPKERTYLIEEFINDGIYSDLSPNTIFDFTNALLKKDKVNINKLYKELEAIDYSPMGLFAIIYKNIKNLIYIFAGHNTSPKDCGMSDGQYYAISNNYRGIYSIEELSKLFLMITDIDKKIKCGELETDLILDYLLVNILT